MRLTIYSKPGCHLCDEMKSIVHRVIAAHAHGLDIAVEEIDISTDRGLVESHGLEIPVLMIDGTKVAKYRVSEHELTRIIDARITSQ